MNAPAAPANAMPVERSVSFASTATFPPAVMETRVEMPASTLLRRLAIATAPPIAPAPIAAAPATPR